MDKIVENKLRNLIRETIREIIQEAKASHNVKVYLKPGEKAPQGAKVSKGARGGQYYYTKGAAQGGKHIGYPKKSDAKLRKFAKDAGLDPDHRDTVDAFNKTEDGKANFEKHKANLEKLRKSSDYTKELDYLTKILPDIKADDLEELILTRNTFETSPPEDYSEMREAKRMANEYWRFLKKHPELEKLGFKEEDVYDPTTM